MHKEQQHTFAAPFMKRYGIKPIVVDPRTMDLQDGLFVEELMASLKSGYDASRPIIVARSDDERVEGQVIDGRHRLYCLVKLQERGVALPSPFPISYVEVKDVDNLRALIAQYESRSQSKGSKYAKAHIERNLKAIIKDNAELHSKDLSAFIKSLGFSNEAITSKIVDEYIGLPSRGKKNKAVQKHRKVVGLPESLAGQWADSSVYATKDDKLDITTSYHNCPSCHVLLKLGVNQKSQVVSIEESVPEIAKQDR